MSRRCLVRGLLLAATLFLEIPPTFAQEITVKWRDLAPLILGEKVAFSLPNGTRIEGKALAVSPYALTIDVQKTSDSRNRPKGKTFIPRSSVSVLSLKRARVLGPMIETGLDVLLGKPIPLPASRTYKTIIVVAEPLP